MRPLAVVLLGLSLPAAALPPKVDLSQQFPTAATRNQGAVGGCHAFSTVSLLEAAIKRRYGFSYALSEADLFVRKVVENPGYYAEVQKIATDAMDPAPVYDFIEGGSVLDDLSFAQRTGVARQEFAPWPAFEKRYHAFAAGQLDKLKEESSLVVVTAKAGQGVNDSLNQVADEEAAGKSDYFASVQRANLHRIQGKIWAENQAERRAFGDFLKQVEGRTKAEAESRLLGSNPALAKDRGAVKALVAPFKVSKWDFKTGAKPYDEECRKDGLEQKKAALAAFTRGVPVSVAMDIGGLKEWGQEKAAGRELHAFTVTGYDTAKDGGIVLKSRNSWGGDNPDVPETRFCRISRMVVVLTDTD